MAKVNIQKVAAQIASKHRLSQKEAEDFVSMAFATIDKGLDADGLVKVKGFGTFKIIDVRERESVNVNTGERVTISGHGKISFTPDSVIKDLINKPFAQFETVIINEGVDIEELNSVHTPDHFTADTLIDNNNNIDNVKITEEDVKSETDNVNEDNLRLDEVVSSEENIKEEEDFTINHLEESESLSPISHDGETQNTLNDNNELLSEETTIVDNKLTNDVEETSTPDDTELVDEKEEPQEILSDKESSDSETIITSDNNDDVNKLEYEDSLINSDEDAKQKCFVGRHIWLLSFGFVFVALLSLCAGYYMGMNKANINFADAITVNAEKHNAHSVGHNTKDSLNKDGMQKVTVPVSNDTVDKSKVLDKSQVMVNKSEATKTDKATQADTETINTTATLSNAQSMVRTGAYIIVGTERIVKVRKGENLKRISKFYLGDGMDCYVQVHNGIEEVSEGMTLKIPLLKVKKKQKR